MGVSLISLFFGTLTESCTKKFTTYNAKIASNPVSRIVVRSARFFNLPFSMSSVHLPASAVACSVWISRPCPVS